MLLCFRNSLSLWCLFPSNLIVAPDYVSLGELRVQTPLKNLIWRSLRLPSSFYSKFVWATLAFVLNESIAALERARRHAEWKAWHQHSNWALSLALYTMTLRRAIELQFESPRSLRDSDPCGVKMKDDFSKYRFILKGARGSASQCCMQLLQ